MRPAIANKISPEIALELMNELIEICNILINGYDKRAYFRLGSLVEQLAQRVREDV